MNIYIDDNSEMLLTLICISCLKIIYFFLLYKILYVPIVHIYVNAYVYSFASQLNDLEFYCFKSFKLLILKIYLVLFSKLVTYFLKPKWKYYIFCFDHWNNVSSILPHEIHLFFKALFRSISLLAAFPGAASLDDIDAVV